MRLYYMICLILITFTLQGCFHSENGDPDPNDNPPIEVNTEDFLSEKQGIQLKNPPKWEKIENEGGVEVVYLSYAENNQDLFRENVHLLIITEENKKTAKEYIDEAREGLKSALQHFKLLDEGPVTINNREGYKIKFAFTRDNTFHLKETSVVFTKGKKIYIISYTALEADYDKYGENAMKIINSFEIK